MKQVTLKSQSICWIPSRIHATKYFLSP